MRKSHAVVTGRLMVIAVVCMCAMFYFALSHVLGNGDKASQAASGAQVVSGDAMEKLALYEKDSDNDGLPDWEELLWGTDPYNPDTFGNGLGDWEEVYGDKGNGGVAVISGIGPVRSENLGATNATELLARRYMSSYMLELQNGFKYLTPEKHDLIVDEAILATLSFFKKVDYGVKDVRKVPATKESRVKYVHNVQNTLVEMFTKAEIDRKAVALIANGEFDQAEAMLTKNITIYNSYLNTLKGVQVPDDATRMHVLLISDLEKYVNSIEGLSRFRSDPLIASASFGMYLKQEQSFENATKSFNLYIGMHRIETSPTAIHLLTQYAQRN